METASRGDSVSSFSRMRQRFNSDAQAHFYRLFPLKLEKPPKHKIFQLSLANIICLQVQLDSQYTIPPVINTISEAVCATFLSLSSKTSPSAVLNCQETQMGQSAASDVLNYAHTGAHTRSSVHCVTHLRCGSTHDARVLTSRASKRPQRDKHTRGP